MSFSAAPSFNDATSAATGNAPAAAPASQGSGIGYYDSQGNPYDAGTRGLWSNTQTSTGEDFNYYPKVDGGAPGQFYKSAADGDSANIGAYDMSKYASPYLAYLDQVGSQQGFKSGNYPTTGLANWATSKGLDPQALVASYASHPADPGWLTGPQDFLEIASRDYKGPNADALMQYVTDPATKQIIADYGAAGNSNWQSAHPAMSMHGNDYAEIASGILSVLGAGAGSGAFGDMGLGASPGAADALDSSLVSTGTNGLGAGTLGNYAQSVGTKLAMSAAKKAALNAIAGKSPTKDLIGPGNVSALYADGGIVDSIDFGGDTNSYTSPPDFSGVDTSGFDPSSFSLPSIDPASFGPAYDTAGLSSWGVPGGSLGMGLPSGGAGAQIDPENTGGSYNMSGYDPNAAASPNGPPTAGDKSMPQVSGEQGAIGKTLQKLGYINDKGDVNLGAALKAGATIAALATQYLQSKKLATQGSALASAQLQPTRMFTYPNSGLSGVKNFGIGKPQNSNSVVQFHAMGGLARHHLAEGGMPLGAPMAGPLGAPTGAMPPSMLPQGGMNRMPGGAAMQPPQQMPTGGPPPWLNQAPPPSAVPDPANHFARGGMMEHMGPGSVHGAGGGQDDLVPAQLSPGEYVFDADTVAALGDGSSEEGARRLDAWRKHLREHKRSAPADKIPPKAHAAPHYLGDKA